MKGRFIITASIAALCGLSSCSEDKLVEGYVKDALGLSGVEGIEVCLGSRKTVTDTAGMYSFAVNAGNHKLAFALEDRKAEYKVLKSDFEDADTVSVPDFYSGFDIREGVKIQKVADIWKFAPKPDKIEGVQGLAIDGDEMFVFHNNGGFHCFNIRTMRYEYYGDVDPEDQYNLHCNESFFGPEKASGKSAHPLLFTSECHHLFNIYIYDISAEGSKLVGTLAPPLPYPTSSYSYDPENNWLYAHNNDWICRYRFPSFSEYTDGSYTLTEEDCLGWMRFEPRLEIPQGACARNGKLYMPAGCHPWAECYITVYDFEKDELVTKVSLDDLEIEPEGIDEKDGWFYVAFNKWGRAIVYRFQFPEE